MSWRIISSLLCMFSTLWCCNCSIENIILRNGKNLYITHLYSLWEVGMDNKNLSREKKFLYVFIHPFCCPCEFLISDMGFWFLCMYLLIHSSDTYLYLRVSKTRQNPWGQHKNQFVKALFYFKIRTFLRFGIDCKGIHIQLPFSPPLILSLSLFDTQTHICTWGCVPLRICSLDKQRVHNLY